MVQPGTYLETVSAAGAGPYKHGRRSVGYLQYCWAGRWTLRSRAPMVQPGTYLETVSAARAGLYKHGRRLLGICSRVGLGAGPYGVGRQC